MTPKTEDDPQHKDLYNAEKYTCSVAGSKRGPRHCNAGILTPSRHNTCKILP